MRKIFFYIITIISVLCSKVQTQSNIPSIIYVKHPELSFVVTQADSTIDSLNLPGLLSLSDSIQHRFHSDVCLYLASKGHSGIGAKIKNGLMNRISNGGDQNTLQYLAGLYLLNDNETADYAVRLVDSMTAQRNRGIYWHTGDIIDAITLTVYYNDDQYYQLMVDLLEVNYSTVPNPIDLQFLYKFKKFPSRSMQVYNDLKEFASKSSPEYREQAILYLNFKDYPGHKEFLRSIALNDSSLKVRTKAIGKLIYIYKDYFAFEAIQNVLIAAANVYDETGFESALTELYFISSPYYYKTLLNVIAQLPTGSFKNKAQQYLVSTPPYLVLDDSLTLLQSIDSLKNYTSQVYLLQYLGSISYRVQLENYLDLAKSRLNVSDSMGCHQYMMLYQRTLDSEYYDSLFVTSNFLTSEGWRFLYNNAQYARDYLPTWKPKNVNATFNPTPQSVHITWTPENSPLMLPNGGGYELYRAVTYEGATVSFTKLNTSLLTTGSYIDNPVISTSIPADKNVYLKYYVIAKNNQNLYSAPSDTIALFVGKTVSGTISSNTTWNENKIVMGNITVNNGVSLTVSPGVVVRFASAKSITSYGVFTAIGTSSQRITFTSLTTKTVGSWGSIVMYNSGAMGSKISYATVKYGTELSAFNVTGAGSGVEISDCIIDTTINAVRFNNSKGIVNRNIVTLPRDHGIIIDNVSTAECFENVLTKTNKSGAAVIYSGGGIGNAWKNKVNGFNWGLASYWGAMPVFGQPANQGINNHVTNCLNGMMIYNWSYPEVGLPSYLDSGATYGNNVFGNTKNVNIYTTPDDTVFAQNVYWGTTNPAPTMQIGSNVKKFDFSNHLTSNTWPSQAPKPPKSFDQQRQESIVQHPMKMLSEDENNIEYGIKLRYQKRYREAKDYFKRMITQNPNNIRAYVELYKTQHETTNDDIRQTFEAFPENVPPFVKFLQSNLLVKSGKSNLAKLLNNKLIQNNPNSVIGTRARLNNFYITLYTDNNLRQAENLLNQIKSKPELSSELELSLAQHALESYTGSKTNTLRGE